MAGITDYEAFAENHPPDSEVELELVSTSAIGFEMKVVGTELVGTVGSSAIALDRETAEMTKEYVRPGERLRGFVVAVHPQHQQIVLSLINPTTDPWRKHAAALDRGVALQGRVLNETVLGYDIELFEGVVAHLPREEVSWDTPQDLEAGDMIDVVVTTAPGLGHYMVVSARRRAPRPGPFNDELVDDWERAVPPGASRDEELQFRRELALDLRSAGLDANFEIDPSADDNAVPETLLVLRDDVAGSVHCVAISHQGLSSAALAAVAAGSRSICELDGPAALSNDERATVARLLAMVDALDAFPWSLDEWLDDAEGAPTTAELEELTRTTVTRDLYFDGASSTKGCVDGRIVAVTQLTRLSD